MIVLKSDPDRTVELAGVEGRVPRPVDISEPDTGFKVLRTLRIYHFSPPCLIEGHAEEDELFIIVLAGAVELEVRSGGAPRLVTNHVLSAANAHTPETCAAYLPPHADYALRTLQSADIAYARARPSRSPAAAVFTSAPRAGEDGVHILLEEALHADRLRIKLLDFGARPAPAALSVISESERFGESLLHLRTLPACGAAALDTPCGPAAPLRTGDTIVLAPGETPTLNIARGASASALIVAAR